MNRVLSLLRAGESPSIKSNFLELKILNHVSKAVHHSEINVGIAFVADTANEIKVPKNHPIRQHTILYALKLVEKKNLITVLRRPILSSIIGQISNSISNKLRASGIIVEGNSKIICAGNQDPTTCTISSSEDQVLRKSAAQDLSHNTFINISQFSFLKTIQCCTLAEKISVPTSSRPGCSTLSCCS